MIEEEFFIAPLLVPTVAYRANVTTDLSVEVISSRPTDICDVIAGNVGSAIQAIGVTCSSWQNRSIRGMYNMASP